MSDAKEMLLLADTNDEQKMWVQRLMRKVQKKGYLHNKGSGTPGWVGCIMRTELNAKGSNLKLPLSGFMKRSLALNVLLDLVWNYTDTFILANLLTHDLCHWKMNRFPVPVTWIYWFSQIIFHYLLCVLYFQWGRRPRSQALRQFQPTHGPPATTKVLHTATWCQTAQMTRRAAPSRANSEKLAWPRLNALVSQPRRRRICCEHSNTSGRQVPKVILLLAHCDVIMPFCVCHCVTSAKLFVTSWIYEVTMVYLSRRHYICARNSLSHKITGIKQWNWLCAQTLSSKCNTKLFMF